MHWEQALQAILIAGLLGTWSFVLSIVQRVKANETDLTIIKSGLKISFASDLIKNPKPTDLEMNELLRKFIDESITLPELEVLVAKLKDTEENGSLKDSAKARGLLRLIHLEKAGH